MNTRTHPPAPSHVSPLPPKGGAHLCHVNPQLMSTSKPPHMSTPKPPKGGLPSRSHTCLAPLVMSAPCPLKGVLIRVMSPPLSGLNTVVL